MKEKTVPSTVATTREEERYLKPAVDICEMQDALVVVADMPGVGSEDVEADVNNNILTIAGKVSSEIPGDETYREFRLHNFYRQFELSEAVDQEKISAEMKNGVLTIKLPKVEKVKPRKIEIKAG